MAINGLEHDAIALVQSYGLSGVLYCYAEHCKDQAQNINLVGSDRTSLEVLSTLLLTAAQQANKTPRTLDFNVVPRLGIGLKFGAK